MSFDALLQVQLESKEEYEFERQKQIESLQDMRQVNSALFGILYEEVKVQDDSIKTND